MDTLLLHMFPCRLPEVSSPAPPFIQVADGLFVDVLEQVRQHLLRTPRGGTCACWELWARPHVLTLVPSQANHSFHGHTS